ncbi:MAG: hypothetical protein ACP5NZ_04305 [Nanobdellota archaeon]
MNKKILLSFGMIFLGVFLITLVSAEFWACFDQGEKINYCSDYRPSETYTGSYPLCMSIYREANNCYVHGVWSKCNNLDPADCANNNGNGSGQFDFTAPVLKIITPTNNSIFNSRKIFLNFTLDETATVYYRDLNKPTVSWIKVCDKCNPGTLASPSYAKLRSFAEGQNKLLFKAVDVVDNEATTQVNFFIDSVKPRIYRTEPRANSFADGNFEVQFKETNPKKLTLYYGNATKNETAILNLSKCYDELSKKVCEIEVNLNKYNSQTILYSFELEDIAGNKYNSKPTLVKVDTKAPVVKNPSSFFKVTGNYVEFNISIDEPNLYKVSMLRNLGTRTTSTTLCTRLTNGYCYKKQSFTGGNYTLSIQIIDQAGHSIAIPATFTIK